MKFLVLNKHLCNEILTPLISGYKLTVSCQQGSNNGCCTYAT